MTVIDRTTARLRAESLMDSICRIYEAGDPVTDPNTGEVTRPEVVVYEGKCKVRPADTQGRDAELGGADVGISRYVTAIPFAVTTVRRGHGVRFLSSPDPVLLQTVFQVADTPIKGDNITARRLLCEEVT